ncbi:MAG: AAA family ATPase [Bacteroidaceae bacterium]|nr:AAA family ATPase [Bacteroidaceae bacterium]
MTEVSEKPDNTAAEFYADLFSILSDRKTAGNRYVLLNRLFLHLLEEQTALLPVSLVGPFAKTDYLLKEYNAPKRLSRMVNDLRVRLNRLKHGELSREEQQRMLADDVQALGLFIRHLYGIPVPDSLAALFPVKRQRRSGKMLLAECLRMIVDRWDDDSIWGRLENDGVEERQVCYARGNSNYPFDWTYLTPLFKPGTQLNLIRPRVNEEGVLYPELIILEPDYLVDISQVARCMDSYSDSPLVYLLRMIEPPAESEAIMLGNLAGQLLDEALHSDSHPYAHSARDFFMRNALSLLATPPGAQFHAKAQTQLEHIRQAISHDLPAQVNSFRTDKVMVEPSFFSPMLGLQGRMDMLQLDLRVLVEQKAGSGAFVPGDTDPSTPKAQRAHYVQLLLYMALLRYNYREQYERNNRQLHAFLLYSKYPKSLLGLGFAPELLFHAFRLRNQLVWHQFRLADGGFNILDSLTPEQLNRNGVQDRLWKDFQRPRIEQLLAPVRQAGHAEKAYYYRMLTFIAREHQLSKLGNQRKENSGFSSIWLDSLDEKLSAGNIYHRLRLVSPANGDEGQVSQVVLRFQPDTLNDMSNFRPGDIVILYSYQKDSIPDACQTMVFRCSIVSITPEEITLNLRKTQVDACVFMRHKKCHWAVEHDFFESSYTALYRGMHAFLSAPRERQRLLMASRKPETDNTLSLQGEYGPFNELSLRVRQARDLFLIIGPPGSGKTSYGMLNTLQEELLHPDTNVLLLSYTNRAVDEICGKLVSARIPFLRIGNGLACQSQYQPYLLDNRVRECSSLTQLQELIYRTRVLVATVTAMNSAQAVFKYKQFSLAIIDEASQILEPHIIGLLSAWHKSEPAIRKFVMIGDHKQLPAVVQQSGQESAVTEPLLHQIGLRNCRLSLFERLLSLYGDDPSVTYMLTRQGRMHQEIMDLPNRLFYGGKLKVVPLPHQTVQLHGEGGTGDELTDLLLTRRIIFLPSKTPRHSPSDKVNQPEADIITALVERIYWIEKERFSAQDTIGIIVPYRNQIATVRNTIARLGIPQLTDITIDTVERYQGSQRRYIIYGFTVQKHYQLRFLTDNTFIEDGKPIDRKLNVAMTRAQEHLIMIGNPAILEGNPLFRQIMKYKYSHKTDTQ